MFNAYPLVRHLLFLIAGILTYNATHFFSIYIYVIAGLLFLLAILSVRTNLRWLRGSTIFSLFYLMGWWLTYQNTPTNSEKHYFNHFNFDAYQATLISNAETKPKTYKAEAEIVAIRVNDKWQPANGKILMYLPLEIAQKPKYGDKYLIKGIPREVEAPKNPLEFNYKTYLFRKGIEAHHFVRENNFVYLGNQPPYLLLSWANQIRSYSEQQFKTYLKAPALYGIANAMVLGLKDELDHDLRDAYAATGAVHILAVSGMHVGIFYLFLQFLFGKLTWNLKPKRKEYPKKEYGFTILIIVFLILYALITGFSPSVVRATVMFSIMQLATLLDRRNSAFNSIAFSALLLLIYNPYWLFEVGFQLSYLAIIGILWLYPYLNQLITPPNKLASRIWSALSVSFAAQLLTFPVSCYYFHQFPNYFLLTNLFVGVFAAVIMYLGIFVLITSTFSTFLTAALAAIQGFFINVLNESIRFIESFSYSVYDGIAISILEIVVIYIIIYQLATFFIEKEQRNLVIASSFFILLFAWNILEDHQQQKNDEITFHFIPKLTAISIINGKQSALISDEKLQKDPRLYDFHFKNYYDSLGITNIKKHIIAQNESVLQIEYNKTKITWLAQKTTKPLIYPTDYLLISNNSTTQLKKLLENQKPKLIIIDNSNNKYTSKKLVEEAEDLSLDYKLLYDTGSVTIKSI